MGTQLALKTDILDMRRQGWPLEDIAEETGVSLSTVKTTLSKAYSASIDQARSLMALNLELERLDALTRAYWEKAIGSSSNGEVLEPDPKSAEMILKIMSQRSKLMQLEGPSENERAAGNLVSILAGIASSRKSTSDSQGQLVTVEGESKVIRSGSVPGDPGGVAGGIGGVHSDPQPDHDQIGPRGGEVSVPSVADSLVVVDEVPGEGGDDGPDRTPTVRRSMERSEAVAETSPGEFLVSVPDQE